MLSDLRSAVRPLFKSPRFALLTILLVGLGVGACTAVYSLFDAALLRDRPGIADSSALVDVGRTYRGSGFDNFSYPDFLDLRADNAAFTDLAAFRFEPDQIGLGVGADAQAATLSWVSPNYFGVTGTRFAAGRNFSQSDQPHAEIVLSHRYWLHRFNADPGVIGREVVVNNHAVTVVGVTEPGFTGSTVLAPDVWAPFPMMVLLDPSSDILTGRPNSILMLLGRLKPGSTPSQAQTDLSRIAARLAHDYPQSHADHGVAVVRSSRFPGQSKVFAAAFLGALGLLTLLAALVACANIAGLMLARGAARRQEYAVRTALGADRRRLLRELLAEQLVLFALGGILGVFFCLWIVDALRLAIPHLPVSVELAVSVPPGALVFSVTLALLLGFLFSIGPALSSSRFDLVVSLRRQEQPVGSRALGLRGLFLILQLSLSLALLATAAGLTGSLWSAARRSPGFDPERLEFIQFEMRNAGLNEASGRIFSDQLLAAAAALPRVEHAAYAVTVPLSGSGISLGPLFPSGGEGQRPILVDWNLVSPDYFATFGIPLLRGRNFTASDDASRPLVAIVNETFARQTWPGREPVGQTLYNHNHQPIEVIGVARDSQYRSLGEAPRPYVYAPLSQLYFSRPTLFVRSREGVSQLASLRELVQRLQPALPLHQAQALPDAIAVGLAPQRVAAWVALAAGGLALVLSVTGIYGITLFWTMQRTREFGVRLALGASPQTLVRHALSGSLRLTGVAALLGLGGAYGLHRIVDSLFGGVSVSPVLLAGITLLFVALVLGASLVPARRATRVDPMIALRAE